MEPGLVPWNAIASLPDEEPEQEQRPQQEVVEARPGIPLRYVPPGTLRSEPRGTSWLRGVQRRIRRRCLHCGDWDPNHLGQNCPSWSPLPRFYEPCSWCRAVSPDHPGRLCGWHPVAIAGALAGAWPLTCPEQGCGYTFCLRGDPERGFEGARTRARWTPSTSDEIARLIRTRVLVPKFCPVHHLQAGELHFTIG